MSRVPPSRAGTQISKYKLQRRLHLGGKSEIYLANVVTAHPDWRPLVVVKMLLPQFGVDREMCSEWLRGIGLWEQLNHPNFVQVFDHGQIEGECLAVMEYVWGLDLHSIAAAWKGRPFPPRFMMTLARKGVSALRCAHDRFRGNPDLPVAGHGQLAPRKILVGWQGRVQLLGSALGPSLASDVRRLFQSLRNIGGDRPTGKTGEFLLRVNALSFDDYHGDCLWHQWNESPDAEGMTEDEIGRWLQEHFKEESTLR